MSTPRTRLIAHTLPYPVAHAICAIDAESEHAPERRLLHILYAVENLLQLLGSVVLIEAFERRDDAGVIEALRELRQERQLSLGLWRSVLFEVAPKIDRLPIPELSRLVFDDAFRTSVKALSDKRNELVHPAHAMDRDEARERVAELRPHLDACIEAVSFLGGWHLLGVCESPQPTNRGVRVRVLQLRGRTLPPSDLSLSMHGGVAERDVVLMDPTLEHAWILRPFFVTARSGTPDELFTLARKETEGDSLKYYGTARPSTLVEESPPQDDRGRSLAPWKWLASPQRRPLRVRLVEAGADVSDDRAVLRDGRFGSADLPLSGLRPFRTGGTSEIFVGRDARSGIEKVLKVPKHANDRALRQQFAEEYRMLDELRAHPGIIDVFSSKEVGGIGLCLVEQFFDHPSLEEHLERGTFADDERREIVRQLLGAVGEIHRRRWVHRDLKPANLLFDRSTRHLKVIDLGIGRRLDGSYRHTTRVGTGTPGIMAPEQLRGGPVTPATDVYALGLLLRRLYSPATVVDRPDENGPDDVLPAWIVPVLQQATHEDPTQRYPDACALLVALEAAELEAAPGGTALMPRDPNGSASVTLAEIDRALLDAIAQVRALEKSVGFTTAFDEFASQLTVITSSLRASLNPLVERSEIKVLPELVSTPVESNVARALGIRLGGALAGFAVPGVVGPVAGFVGALASGTTAAYERRQTMLATCRLTIERLEEARIRLAISASAPG